MIFDCFTFYNELDLLDIRLHELYDVVDKFVLVEGNLTHSGEPKESVWDKNKDRFKDVADKVIWYNADLTRYSSTEERENGQRNAIRDALNVITPLGNNDIVTICDADEIPAKNLAKLDIRGCVSLEQKFCNYYLNNIAYDKQGKEKKWPMARACRFWYMLGMTPQAIRMLKPPRALTHECGWHFSFVGGADQIKNKIKVYLHQEFNNDRIINGVDAALANNVDVLARHDREYRLTDIELPDYVVANKDKFAHLLGS